MRVVLFVLLLILTAAGPWHYLTDGAAARGERRSHLENLARAAAGVRGLLERHTPPSRHLLDRARNRLERRHSALPEFADELTAALSSLPATVERLRQMAMAARVDQRVLAPFLATLAGDPLIGERRRALAAVLAALAESGDLILTNVRVARKLSRPEARLPVTLLGVSLTVLGCATDLTRLSERLAAGSGGHPPGDLIDLILERLPETEWNRLGWTSDSPPLQLKLTADLIVGRETSP